MKPGIRSYALGMTLATVTGAALALPFSVVGGSALPGKPVLATLNDASTAALEAATVLIEFDPTRLDYISAALGGLFPNGTIHTQNLGEEALGRVILGISSNANPLSGVAGSLLDINFDILANAPTGLTAVTFRCVPVDAQLPVNAVSDQNSADQLCAPDYAIPATSGNINVLAAPTAQAPVSGTASLILLGFGLMVSMRGRVARPAGHVLHT